MFPTVPAYLKSSAKAIRRHATSLMLFSGVAVLGYAGFQYGAMLIEQRHLQALWREQQKVDHASDRHPRIAFHDSGLTRISIPRIQLSAVAVEGTDLLSLMIAPGHLTGTPEPGEPGNSVISAHRDTFFHNIADLNTGDQIVVERNGLTYTYAIEEMRIVSPKDISVVAPTSDSRLTLITCDPAYYPGPAPHRLVIISKLLNRPPASPSFAGLKQSPSPIKQAAVKKRR